MPRGLRGGQYTDIQSAAPGTEMHLRASTLVILPVVLLLLSGCGGGGTNGDDDPDETSVVDRDADGDGVLD